MDKKVCPLKIIGFAIASGHGNTHVEYTCDEDNCAWWCFSYSAGKPTGNGHCAVTDLAYLADIAGVHY